MKRLCILPLVFLFGLSAFSQDRPIVVVPVFKNVNALVNSTNTYALDLDQYKPNSFTYSLQVLCTNAAATNTCGKVALAYEVSNNNTDYLSSSNITAEISFTNSPTAGGKGFYSFTPGISRYLRIRAITTDTNAFLSGWLAIQ
ncbi:MAG: hypothetical protein WC551_12245 [Patescibacteria group bacterium]